MSPPREPSISAFRVSNFRCFEDLRLSRLGRVNLIVGKNSVGKSTLLEALDVFGSRAKIQAMGEVAERRGEAWGTSVGEADALLSMFNSDPVPGASIGLASQDSEFSIRLTEVQRRKDPDGFWRYQPIQEVLPLEERMSRQDLALAIEVLSNGTIAHGAILDAGFRLRSRLRWQEELDSTPAIGSQFVPAGGLTASALARLWDNVALSPREDEVTGLLQTVFPNIERISMRGSGSDRESRAERRAYVRASEFKEPVPLLRLGDGVSRMLGIAIALVNAQGGLLLIDEFENGLHYSIQEQVWDFVFDACERMNVQAFLTTHSGDCIRAFARAAVRSTADGALIRLERKSGKIKAVQVDEEILKIAERNEVELR